MSKNDLGTQIEVIRNSLFQCGGRFMRFYGNRTKKVMEILFKYIGGNIGEVATTKRKTISYRPQMLSDDFLSFGINER